MGREKGEGEGQGGSLSFFAIINPSSFPPSFSICASGVPYFLEAVQRSGVRVLSSLRHLEDCVKRKTLTNYSPEVCCCVVGGG